METLMVDRVQSSLRLFMHRNAIFLCERLCAHFPSEVNLELLATCYLQNNQAHCAYNLLKGAKLPHSRYLFALSCFRMNLLSEAEAALCPPNDTSVEVPNGASGHYLIGLIYRYTGRRTSAIDHFMQALAIDPLLWSAYEELCILGAAEEASICFSDAAAVRIQQQYSSESSSDHLTTNSEHLNQNSLMGSGDSGPGQLKQLHANSSREISNHPHGMVLATSQATISGSSNSSQYNTPPAAATQLSAALPPPLCRNAHLHLNTMSSDASAKPNINAAVQAPRRKFVDEGKLRKVSGRLFSDSGPRRSSRLSGEAATNSNIWQVGGNGTNNTSAKFIGGFSSSSSSSPSKVNSASLRSVTVRKGHPWAIENFDEGRRPEAFDDLRTDYTASTSSSMPILADAQCLEQGKITGSLTHDSRLMKGALDLLGLLRTVGEGYRLSCLYKCQDALESFLKLPQNHFNTGWVLSQVGKLHFELVNYVEAGQFFELARQVSPYNLEGMDMYSTALYHLKEEMKLSYLAQELISVDRLSPQAWCAMGNCYSLQKDHETALKSFQRAVHLDSRFAYAHTLCGHEHVALEDYDNGIKCYQSALTVDERHYNAWYGLGVVYLQQEKFEFAEHHFRRAFHINPHSSVLMCYLGMSLHSLKRNEEALGMMERAILADKKNPLPMYQKADILLSLGRFSEALNELEQLKEFAPRESSVYALMGRIYRRLDMHEKSMYNFGIALDLKPPAADVANIKAAMEKLHLPDEMEDSP